MAETPSTMLELGTPLPGFRLRDPDGKVVTSRDFADARGVLVLFICPHCPYVRHIRAELARAAADFQQRGVAVVAINSNDVEQFAEDGPDGMREEAREVGYTFPYLYAARPARPISSSSTAASGSSTAGSSTAAGPRIRCPSPARTSARPWI
jgi:hypothetical protein